MRYFFDTEFIEKPLALANAEEAIAGGDIVEILTAYSAMKAIK